MEKFVSRHANIVTSILSGFDRLVFRGHLMPLMRDGGMFFFLEAAKVRLLDFGRFALATSDRVKQAALATAMRQSRPVRYLPPCGTSKEELARAPISLTSVEKSWNFMQIASAPTATDQSVAALR